MMSHVRPFLNDAGGNFSETAPRPPIPGEENDLHSSGGTSTRSSGSQQSGFKNPSAPAKIPSTSALHHTDQLQVATPRRSNLDKSHNASVNISYRCQDEVEAPLGFEPEGSVANSPHFSENTSGTPPYLKWAENLQYLLDDSDGVKLFKQFLDQEQCSNLLDFWFACRGLKMVSADNTRKILSLVKLIYRKYIKGDVLSSMRADIKREITERVKHEDVDQTIFDEAQRQVENNLRNDSYPLFLKSDLYVQYVSCGGDSPKTSCNSSGSNSVHPHLGPLPTLPEGEELRPEDLSLNKSDTSNTLNLTLSALNATRFSRAAMPPPPPRNIRQESYIPPNTSRGTLNPYHVSYAPVSAQDSEQQSLSSDALTDDTMSLTDSSVDGRDVGGKKNWRTRKAMQRNAQINRNTALNQQDFIPRTERAPKDRNIAETDPVKFANMLIERLEVVKDEIDKLDKMKETIKLCDSVTTTDEEEVRSLQGCSTAPKSMPSVGSLQLNALIASAMAEDDNAQSILDDHFSRIWDGSSGQTPSRSPGRSPDRGAHRSRSMLAGPSPNVSAAFLRTLAQKPRKEKEPHLISMLSFDSGVGGEDKAGVYGEGDSNHYSRYVHHHHHHHHMKDSKHRQEQGDVNARSRGMTYYTSDPHMRSGGSDPMNTSGVWEERGRSRDAKRSSSSAKKCSDTSSNIDSGVSLRFDASPHQVPNIHNPANEKVLNWMLENEKLHSGPSGDSDKSSSHKRSSHKSGSSMSASAHRSSSKKAAYGGSSRSASLDRSRERGGLMIGDFNQGAPMMPAQPIVQDPSMPLLNPPNPTTQLEEAKRRLEDESKQRIIKSRSFTGSSSKDRRAMPAPLGFAAPPPRSLPIANRTIPSAPNTSLNLSATSEDPNMSARSDRSSRPMPVPKKPSSSAPNTPAADVTVVGYYFCGEPIPYRTTVPGRSVTLAQFKQLITKRGNYRYFFKKASDEFDSGVILEEVSDDFEVLPLWDGKVVGKVEKIE